MASHGWGAGLRVTGKDGVHEMTIQFQRRQESYLSCPRCSLVVLQGSEHDGSPICRDCRAEDDTTVKMDLLVVELPASVPPR